MIVPATQRRRTRPEAQCPLRPGDLCNLCQLDVTGPQDCGLVYLVMDDPELRELYANDRKQRRARATGAGDGHG